jgi:hypothetical protein
MNIGDMHLLELKEYGSIEIVTAKGYVEIEKKRKPHIPRIFPPAGIPRLLDGNRLLEGRGWNRPRSAPYAPLWLPPGPAFLARAVIGEYPHG